MTSIASLGISRPAGLDYLVNEGLLPADPKPDQYGWETFDESASGLGLEEVVTTSTCAVWSQAGVIRRVFRLELEDQHVTQATLTWFDSANRRAEQDTAVSKNASSKARFSNESLGSRARLAAQGRSHRTRALVVFLVKQAHIYYLDGSSHIISLPFEVERAFPTPKGLLLQRKLQPDATRQNPTSPVDPFVPPNSFFSPQRHSPPSPSIRRNTASAGKSLRFSLNPQHAPKNLEDFDLGIKPDSETDMPLLFTLTDPLLPIGLAVEALAHKQLPSMMTDPSSGLETAAMSSDEELLYMSAANEISLPSHSNQEAQERDLLIALTFNRAANAYSVWYCSYQQPKSASSWRTQLNDTRRRAGKDRFRRELSGQDTKPDRKSGARDSLRHSFHSRKSFQPSEANVAQVPGTLQVGKTRKTDPDAAMKPVLESPEKAKEVNRRMSSMLARTDLHAQDGGMSKTTHGTARSLSKRGPSFSQTLTDRRSFRLSQISARSSFGGTAVSEYEEDTSMLDDSMLDDHPLRPSVHTGYESFYDLDLQDPFDDTRRDLMLTRVVSIQAAHTNAAHASQPHKTVPPPAGEISVLTLSNASSQRSEDGYLQLLVHDKAANHLSQITIRLQNITVRNGLEKLVTPILNDYRVVEMFDCQDIARLADDNVRSLLTLRTISGRSQLDLYHDHCVNLIGCPPVTLGNGNMPSDETVTAELKSRPLPVIGPHLQLLAHTGPQGCINVVNPDRSHQRVRIGLKPGDAYVGKVIDFCDTVSGPSSSTGTSFLMIYWTMCQRSCPNNVQQEWELLVACLLTPFVPHLHGGPTLKQIESHPSSAPAPQSDQAPYDYFSMKDAFSRANNTWNRLTETHGRQQDLHVGIDALENLLVMLHLFQQEELLNTCSCESLRPVCLTLAPVLAQMAYFLHWGNWSRNSPWAEGLTGSLGCSIEFDGTYIPGGSQPPTESPPDFHAWVCKTLQGNMSPFDYQGFAEQPSIRHFLPRMTASAQFRAAVKRPEQSHEGSSHTMDLSLAVRKMLDTLPDSIAAPMRGKQKGDLDNPTHAAPINNERSRRCASLTSIGSASVQAKVGSAISTNRTVTDLCDAKALVLDQDETIPGSLLPLIHRHDTAYAEVDKLLHSHIHPIAVVYNNFDNTEAQFLEAERAYSQLIGIRSTAITSGTALFEYHSSRPLPTQQLEIGLWETQIRMMPSGHVMTLSREIFTEPKVAWAAYHTGAAAGLKIEGGLSSLDSSWISLNKPSDPNNRHAGLLLGLGLNGYLKTMPRWLVFKYLTPKHEMTSISLLIGLSASHLGTMNTLVVKVLSIHLVSLLPPGASELNLSSLVQTAGTMGVGLLYLNSHHRRMSEVMLSELEYVDKEDPYDIPARFVRDEGYRLAAGFALGLVNLGRGRNMRSLQDMRVEERLLALATGSRDVAYVNIIDQAAAGATMALTLIFMKTGNRTLADKIAPPSAKAQFDYIRPDVMLLRVVAKTLIMWGHIEATDLWIFNNLPSDIQDAVRSANSPCERAAMLMNRERGSHGARGRLRSTDLHTYSIVAGLCWSVGLKFAGARDEAARDFLLMYYDSINILNESALSYDEQLAGAAMLRLQHLILLSAATIMSGTGDLAILRRTRILHGTVNKHSTFGLHQAAHMAMGALYLGQGRFSFSTSDLAIASLLIAFYPLYPKEVMDNKAHLQAFRHFWVLAAEPRCVFPRDVETTEIVVSPIEVGLKNGETRRIEAPGLLHPSLEAISRIQTLSEEHEPTLVNLEEPAQRDAFLKNQTIWLKKRNVAAQFDDDPYAITLALTQEESIKPRSTKTADHDFMQDVFDLDVFSFLALDRATMDDLLPAATASRPSNLGVGNRSNATQEANAKHGTQRAERKKALETELLRAMPTLAQSYAPPRKDENAVASDDRPDSRRARSSISNMPLESLLDIRTTKVDDVLSLWAAAKKCTPGQRHNYGIDMLFELNDEQRGSYIGPETIEALKATALGEAHGLDERFAAALAGMGLEDEDSGLEEEERDTLEDGGVRLDEHDASADMDIDI